FQAEDGIRDFHVTGVQTCALPICIVGQGRRRRGRCLHRRAGGRLVQGQGIVQRQFVAQVVLVQGQRQGIVFSGSRGATRVQIVRSDERRGGQGWCARTAA